MSKGRKATYDLKDLKDELLSMEVGDCLQWSVKNLHAAYVIIHAWATQNKIKVAIRSPSGGKKDKTPGMVFIMRYI